MRRSSFSKQKGYWAKIIALQEGSGLGVAAFTKKYKVGKSSFYVWRNRLKGRKQAAKRPDVFALVTVKKEAIPTTSSVTVAFKFPSGVEMFVPIEEVSHPSIRSVVGQTL